MSRFFIDRPVFAWVIAILIMVAGAISLTQLPIARYPDIAPPTVTINAMYPGASAKTVEDSITQVIEQVMTGLDGLLYISSTSSSNGSASVTLTFESGVDADIAQVHVQNKLQAATPLLPQIVQQQGVRVEKANPGFLMVIAFVSEDGSMERSDISDYLTSNVAEPMSRLPGVGSVQVFGARYAMRVWLDPNKLDAYKVTAADVVAAIRAQNAVAAAGQIGATPALPGNQLNVTVTAQGRLNTPEQFRAIVVRSNPNGSSLKLGDIARVELGAQSYDVIGRFNGHPSSGIGVSLATNANALDTARRMNAFLDQVRPTLPPGLKAVIPMDSTPFIKNSIREVVKTLAMAIVLVFLVIYLFLQNLSATFIPTIAVPVVLLGTLGVLQALGFSINMLTMFAMVLAIGLLVDDAIVVVENVERLMSEEGLTPIEATRKSMDQISTALVGVGVVLSAVFVPMAFLGGSTGVIYKQFSATIVSAMVLSVLVALMLTPALCATMLKRIERGHHAVDTGFFGWFNRKFDSGNARYQSVVRNMVGRPRRFLLAFVLMVGLMAVLFLRLPSAFLPDEDQGTLFTTVLAPVGATQERTLKVMQQVEQHYLENEKRSVDSLFTVQGIGFGGGGQNTGVAFVSLKDWTERPTEDLSAKAVAGRAMRAFSQIRDALVFAFPPPAIPELGTSSGFNFYLKDTTGLGHERLLAARNQFLGMAAQSKLLTAVRPNGLEDAPQFRIDVDVAKATALGVPIADINSTLQTAWGGQYIDDFIDRGRVKRVLIQADAPFRMTPEDFNKWSVKNARGDMVRFSAFATTRWDFGSPRLERYNGAPAMNINGQAAPGVSSGAAMVEVQKLVGQLPAGITLEWTGTSYQERAAGAQTPLLYSLSLLVVFLCLAALYESWSVPTVALMVVPLGILGTVLASSLRGLERDVYFQVAMLTTVGLSSKNAILIIQFARHYLDEGMELVDATIAAVRDRLRPILMTSLAFGFGVLPLAIATGAGSGAQRAIGTGVLGGMVAGTFLGIFFVPIFFVGVQRLLMRRRKAAPSAQTPAVGISND